jgi:hypothetical protein
MQWIESRLKVTVRLSFRAFCSYLIRFTGFEHEVSLRMPAAFISPALHARHSL